MKSLTDTLFKFSYNEDEGDNDKSSNDETIVYNGDIALQSSINAALSIFSILKTSLGPRSMSKLIQKSNGQYIISNDGATILSNITVTHPAAVLLVNIALSQDREIGDGTTSIVLIAGEILKSITQLYFQSRLQGNPIHQTTITTILHQLSNEILSILNSISIEYDKSNTDTLFKMAGVALGTKHYSYWTKNLTTITINAIQNSTTTNNSSTGTSPTITVDISNNIQICKLQGGNIDQSCFLKGLIVTSKSTPILKFTNGNVSLKTLIIGYDIQKHIQQSQSIHSNIKSTSEMNSWYKINDNLLVSLVNTLVTNRVLLVFFKYKIPDLLAQLLYSNNISIIQDFNHSTDNNNNEDTTIINKLSKLTNSMPIMKYDELDFHLFQQQEQQQQDKFEIGCFGNISKIEILNKFEDDYFIYLNNEVNDNSKLSCIVLRGPTKDIVDDLEIGIIDSLHLIKSSIESTPMIVYGGGCCEMAISIGLLKYSDQIDLSIDKQHGNNHNYWKKEISKVLSSCFQIIPSILVMNAYNSLNNKSPLEVIAELSKLHNSDDGDFCSFGIDGWTGEIKDMKDMNLIEPLILKKSIITTSIEACITLLRIDTIVSTTSNYTS